jgi:ankyrin repeat protein
MHVLCKGGCKPQSTDLTWSTQNSLHSSKVTESPWCSGFTPLLIASRTGSASVVNELIKRGADINGRCANGQTALYYAREQGHNIIAQVLVDRGATFAALFVSREEIASHKSKRGN